MVIEDLTHRYVIMEMHSDEFGIKAVVSSR